MAFLRRRQGLKNCRGACFPHGLILFSLKVQAGLDAGIVNEYVKLEVTQSGDLPGGAPRLHWHLFACRLDRISDAGCFYNPVHQTKRSMKSLPLTFTVDSTARVLWGAAMLTVPVTSFRWFPFLGEGALVRPLAMYPLALLLPLIFIQWRRGNIRLNGRCVRSAGSIDPLYRRSDQLRATIDPIPLRGQIYSGRAIRALATLLIGLTFFISAIWMNQNEDDLRFWSAGCLPDYASTLRGVVYRLSRFTQAF